MTMNREAKAEKLEEIKYALRYGYTTTKFASPKLIKAALADRGHTYMTAAEYRALRMDRGQMPACRIEVTRETMAIRHRRQRIIGGRRITGCRPGTKKLI